MTFINYIEDIVDDLYDKKDFKHFLKPERRIHLGILVLMLSVLLYFLDVFS